MQPLLPRPLPRSFWSALVIAAAGVGVGLGLNNNAQAHPHEWIDLRVRLISTTTDDSPRWSTGDV